MQTPRKLTPPELAFALQHWLDANAVRNPVGTWSCKACGELLSCVDVYFSLHNADFGEHCVGAGRVKVFAIPFCTNCEAAPETSSCLHVPGEMIPVTVRQELLLS